MVAWSGPVRDLHFDDTEREVDLYDAIGEIEGLFDQLRITASRRAADPGPPWRPGSVVEFMHDDTCLGRVGELAPAVRRALDVEPAVLLAEFEFDAMLDVRTVRRVRGGRPPGRLGRAGCPAFAAQREGHAQGRQGGSPGGETP